MTDKPTVTQADRYAAEAYIRAGYEEWHIGIGDDYIRAERIALGLADDDTLVQAFARHRTSHQPQEREAVLEEAAQIADAEHRHLTNCYQKPAKKDAETAFRISHAIRALKTTPAPTSEREAVLEE